MDDRLSIEETLFGKRGGGALDTDFPYMTETQITARRLSLFGPWEYGLSGLRTIRRVPYRHRDEYQRLIGGLT